jgi:trimethylamine--corrinoid protein Co-methyltransferase
MLLNLACIEMMKHYRLPHCGSSGSGTGWGPDLLAAETYWMNLLTTCLASGGLAPFVGDTLNSKAFSPVSVVFVHEIIAQSLRLAAGLHLDNASLVLEEIIAAGPGGSFLNTKSTRSLYRSAYYSSPVFTRFSMEKWQAHGQPSADRVLREYTHRLLQELTPPADQADLLTRGEAFIAHR